MHNANFWDKVHKTSFCWIWLGYITDLGYGRLFYKGKRYLAHRLAYELTNGPFNTAMLICHRCDIPYCVNPAHLYLGTPKHNSLDAVMRNRIAYGENSGQSKLTNEDVLQIRHSIGIEKQKDIAFKFKVDPSLISQIHRGIIWKRSYVNG